jgi:NRAMP (natural resistance-associated macrophage protein)-like metal ion transporter
MKERAAAAAETDNRPSRRRKPRGLLRTLGPGLITGAADDDPNGIATYSQTGAQFGYSLGWLMIVSYPMMVIVQGISAGIGAVTGAGIAENLRRHYPPWMLHSAVLMLLIANIFNIGADLAAMGAALQLVIGGPHHVYALGFAIVCVLLEVFVTYARYVSVLKWLTLSLFAYVGVVFAVHLPWGTALSSLVVPTFRLDADHAMAIVAILGTTISPYLFFWQAGEEMEEMRRREKKPLLERPAAAPRELKRIETDTLVGMAVSNLVALFIIFATAATLHVNGITEIESSSQAAEALRPVAGEFAFLLFALGIIGTGMLAVPVLAGSAAYAVSEMFRWRAGLDQYPGKAKAFYGVIAAATLGGVVLTFTPLDPIRALYWSAVINGVLAAPLIAIMVAIGTNRRIMGELRMPWWMALGGGITAFVMASAAVAFFLA